MWRLWFDSVLDARLLAMQGIMGLRELNSVNTIGISDTERSLGRSILLCPENRVDDWLRVELLA